MRPKKPRFSSIPLIPLLATAAMLSACAHGKHEEQQHAAAPPPVSQPVTLGSQSAQPGSTQVTTEREVTATMIEKHQIPTVQITSLRADLNRVNAKQLEVLGLPQDVAQNTVKYRDVHGRFGDINTLMQVPGMNQELFSRVSPRLGVS